MTNSRKSYSNKSSSNQHPIRIRWKNVLLFRSARKGSMVDAAGVFSADDDDVVIINEDGECYQEPYLNVVNTVYIYISCRSCDIYTLIQYTHNSTISSGWEKKEREERGKKNTISIYLTRWIYTDSTIRHKAWKIDGQHTSYKLGIIQINNRFIYIEMGRQCHQVHLASPLQSTVNLCLDKENDTVQRNL